MAATTDTQHPQVRSLNAMLQVQEGAVVSRVLIKEKGGNVTFFAFDAGEGLSEHTCPYHALVQGVEGVGEIEIRDVERLSIRIGAAARAAPSTSEA